MTYESFRDAFTAALQRSKLGPFGRADERLDLGSLDRTFETTVEPAGGQKVEPFFVTAGLSWRWSAMNTARAHTNEEDALVELLGPRAGRRRARTERRWVRVDLDLRATLPHGHPLALDDAARWQRWSREATTRLELSEPLVGDPVDEDDLQDGLPRILAWQGQPTATFAVEVDGSLGLERVAIEAWQRIDVPRTWDDGRRRPDPSPSAPLDAMFARVQAALLAWMEALDHLAVRPDRR